MIQHHSPISGIAAWGDQFVATAGYDNQVILWDTATREPIARGWHDHLANQCSFSPDGRHLITSSSDYTARLWSVPNLRLLAVLGDHDDDVEMAAFNPVREIVATASRDHRVRVYDFAGTLLAVFEGHIADVISVEWSSDGQTLISSSDDGTIKRWSVAEGRLVEDIDMGGVETDTVVLCADGTIFAGDDAGRVTMIDAARREVVQAHQAGIKRLVFDEARGLLASLSYDRTMRLWSLSDGTLRLRSATEFPAIVWPRSCAFGSGSTLVFGTFGASYLGYDYERGQWEDVTLPGTGGINAVAVYGHDVLTVGDAGIVRDEQGRELARTGSLCNFLTPARGLVISGGQLGVVFDALTGTPLHQHRSPLNCGATFVRDGVQHVLVGTYTGEGLLFRIPSAGRAEFVTELRLHDNAVKGVASSGTLLLSVCADTSATWIDLTTLETVATIPQAHDRIANGCAGLDGGRFASVSRDLRLRIWEPDRTVSVVNTPHTHSVKCVAGSSDGRLVAVGSYYGEVAVYDRQLAHWVHTTRPTAAGVSSLTYDPAHGDFLASSYDGRVYRIIL